MLPTGRLPIYVCELCAVPYDTKTEATACCAKLPIGAKPMRRLRTRTEVARANPVSRMIEGAPLVRGRRRAFVSRLSRVEKNESRR